MYDACTICLLWLQSCDVKDACCVNLYTVQWPSSINNSGNVLTLQFIHSHLCAVDYKYATAKNGKNATSSSRAC